ncbi:MAG: hypothetical protein GY828_02530 [Candidatus Gracilibacteria bacterium]|nr:hypothetical protein [Candidatus Gracilibacteria bacterium]
MEIIPRTKFIVAGLKITTNNTSAMKNDTISEAWSMFFGKDVYSKIPNKIDDRIYAVYGNFEENFSEDNMKKNYDMIIGCKVESLDGLPKWLSSIEIPEQDYAKFVAVGNMPGAVLKEWENIWSSQINKNFSVDFEVYSEKSQKGKLSEVDIYVGVK